jgi:hypothetical protein
VFFLLNTFSRDILATDSNFMVNAKFLEDIMSDSSTPSGFKTRKIFYNCNAFFVVDVLWSELAFCLLGRYSST